MTTEDKDPIVKPEPRKPGRPRLGDAKLDRMVQVKVNSRRHADLLIRIKHDGLTVSKFVRGVFALYLENDPKIAPVVEHLKILGSKHGKAHRKLAQKMIEKGRENKDKFGLGDDDIENIFDILEADLPSDDL